MTGEAGGETSSCFVRGGGRFPQAFGLRLPTEIFDRSSSCGGIDSPIVAAKLHRQ